MRLDYRHERVPKPVLADGLGMANWHMLIIQGSAASPALSEELSGFKRLHKVKLGPEGVSP